MLKFNIGILDLKLLSLCTTDGFLLNSHLLLWLPPTSRKFGNNRIWVIPKVWHIKYNRIYSCLLAEFFCCGVWIV